MCVCVCQGDFKTSYQIFLFGNFTTTSREILMGNLPDSKYEKCTFSFNFMPSLFFSISVASIFGIIKWICFCY